jgi:ATP adenylyltransferase
MDRLWAPWRRAYVTNQEKPEGCLFCHVASAEPGVSGPGELVLGRGEHSYAMLNAYPYNNGHLMVVPFQHTGALDEVEGATLDEMLRTAAAWTALLRAEMRAEGFNVGFNLGAAAGAGLAEHVHLHVVPRWAGDTNLMPVVGDVKVLPEALDVTASRLRSAWQAAYAGAAHTAPVQAAPVQAE